MSWVIFVGPFLIVCSFYVPTLFSSKHILMLLRLVTPPIIALYLSVVCFWWFLLLGRLRSKQLYISHSSLEADLRATTLATIEVTWLWWLLEDLGICVSVVTSLLSDSTGALSIAWPNQTWAYCTYWCNASYTSLGTCYKMMLLSFALCFLLSVL